MPPKPRPARPLALRLSPTDIARADRLCKALAARHVVAGLPPPSRHSVLVQAVRVGLAAIERKVSRGPA